MHHFFDIEMAEKFGIPAAVLYTNIQYWVHKNEAENRNFHDGKYWTFNSTKAFLKLFPYLNIKAIDSGLDKLEKAGLIQFGNYNLSNIDRTRWFTLADSPKMENGAPDSPKMTLRLSQMGESTIYTNINTDINRKEMLKEKIVGASPPVIKDDAVPHREIISLYHKYLPMCPKVRDWTYSRHRTLVARWNADKKRQNLEFWEKLFQYIATCDFLTGRTNPHRPFFASLPWILNQENFAKIRENHYVNR